MAALCRKSCAVTPLTRCTRMRAIHSTWKRFSPDRLRHDWPRWDRPYDRSGTCGKTRRSGCSLVRGPGLLASAARPVAQKDRPALKPALVEQLEPRAGVVRQRSLATADENRHEQQLQLVDQARDDRLTGELGAADADV